MFILKLYDIKGVELNLGDMVEIRNSSGTKFYTRVSFDNNLLKPFETFSFHSILKVDKLPDNAIQKDNYWYCFVDEKSEENFAKYHMSWVECQHNLENKCFRIMPIDSQLKLFKTY